MLGDVLVDPAPPCAAPMWYPAPEWT